MKNLADSIGHSTPAAGAGTVPATVSGPPTPRPNVQKLTPPALSHLYGFRRAGGQVARKVRKLVGRPDNSPWVLRPRGSSLQNTFVDFIFGLDYLSPNSPLVSLLHDAMAPYGLSVLLVNQDNVDRVIEQIDRGWLQPHALLDLASITNPRFRDLVETSHRRGIYVVDDPINLTTWTVKAWSHAKLEKAGLPVPPTVILPKGSPDRELTPEERARIGERCVIKPSIGYSNRGVVIGAAPTAASFAAARDFDRSDDWLVQKMIAWTRFKTERGDRPAYLRAYHLFGHRSLLWWCKENGHDYYDLLTWDDLRKYDLLPVVDLIDRVAQTTGVDFFSSEVAITSESGPGRLVLIDYVNDQCDMDPEARPGTTPVPEPWVKWVCARMAEFVWRRKHGLPREENRTLTLFSD